MMYRRSKNGISRQAILAKTRRSVSERAVVTAVWVTRRSNFLPLDESPFTNELFVPAYSDFFFQRIKDRKIVEGLVSTWEDRAFAAMEMMVGERQGRGLLQPVAEQHPAGSWGGPGAAELAVLDLGQEALGICPAVEDPSLLPPGGIAVASPVGHPAPTRPLLDVCHR